jgi:uncharacterized protein
MISGFPGATMNATTVDAFEFCRLGEQLSGTTPVSALTRLAAEAADASGEIRWAFAGGRHPKGFPQLQMKVDGDVSLICQRCLTPFRHPVVSETVLVLVRDEAAAGEAEETLDDESIDVIVVSSTQDLLQLVEDEALLSLPLSPRHEVCPGGAPKLAEDKPESPFAVLKKLDS